jgi:hypothetical protein
MKKVVIDAELRDKLLAEGTNVELIDEKGNVVGRMMTDESLSRIFEFLYPPPYSRANRGSAKGNARARRGLDRGHTGCHSSGDSGLGSPPMKHRVVWLKRLTDQMHTAGFMMRERGRDPTPLFQATREIDVRLERNPSEEGESRDANERVFSIDP